MPFEYSWDNDEKTVLRLRAVGDWNWKDYHTVAHVASVNVGMQPNKVDIIIDLTSSPRDRAPGGLAAHARTFGKRLSDKLTGRAVVVGLSDADLNKLGVTESRTMSTPDGEVRFVDSLDDARAVIADWQENE